MKILRLRFQNLNSLRGASEIDFESGPLGLAGLFAITGPTGAGKSTLLDAMTLALYGKAARYGSQPSPETMMSRHTGECFAEVEFSCSTGRFRSSWHLQRAHRKPGGKLQNPKRRIIALPAETVLTEKNEESGRLIEQLTGLDYERFLRSVMLAQGDFAAFLKARPDDRANLLEQVTGTSLYRDISVESFQRFTRAKAAHELLLGQSANIQVLPSEERQRRLSELGRLGTELAAFRQNMAMVQSRLQAGRQWQAWERAQALRMEALKDLEQECRVREPELSRLALGEKARLLAPSLSGLDREEAHVRTLEEGISSTRTLLPSLSDAVARSEVALDQASRGLEQEALAQEQLQALWLRVQQLDTQVDACLLGLQPLEAQSAALDSEMATARSAFSAQASELAEIAAILRKGRDWLEANAADACLAELDAPSRQAAQAWGDATRRVADISKRIQNLDTESDARSRAVDAAALALAGCQARLEEPGKAEAQSRAALASLLPADGLAGLEEAAAMARRRREQAAALLDHVRRFLKEEAQAAEFSRETSETAVLLKELELRRDHCQSQLGLLEKVHEARRQAVLFAERCAALVQERPLLQEGRECPLCGATHHPWAHLREEGSGDLAKAHAAEQQAAAELRQQDKLLLELQTREASTRERSSQLNRARDLAEAEAKASAAVLLQLQAQLGLPKDRPSLAFCTDLASDTLAQEQQTQRRFQDCRAASDTHQLCLAELHRLEALRDAAAAGLAGHQALLEQLSRQLLATRSSLAEASLEELHARQAAVQLLGSLPFPTQGDQAAYSLFIDKLQQRARLFVKGQQKVQDQLQKQVLLETSSKALSAQLEKLSSSRADLQARMDAERGKLRSLRSERSALFGEGSIEASRLDARSRLASITKVHTNAAEFRREAGLRLQAAERELERLRAEAALAKEQLRTLALNLSESFSKLGFSDLSSLRSALLSPSEHESLSALQRSLSGRRAALEAENSRLEREAALLPAGASEDAARAELLGRELLSLEASCAEVSRAMGAHEECIRIDVTNRARLGTLLTETEAAHREFARWDSLRALIGSADGSLFARFAQGLTLDRLAWLANIHLVQLNPRYSVRRSRGPEARDLELEIMDHYQADVVRPMGSLSGGESFLVSLALALALSELASGKSAIESLFIDEGFGALDADTLEAAMAALEGLQSRGKTIGVISHVAVMQERIATQIRVIKESGGCSRILVVG